MPLKPGKLYRTKRFINNSTIRAPPGTILMYINTSKTWDYRFWYFLCGKRVGNFNCDNIEDYVEEVIYEKKFNSR